MNLQRLFIPLLVVAVLWAAWRAYGWGGVALAAGGVLMWVLLHFTRVMTVLKRAANRPVGWVGSAVMLNARLKPGQTLLHVIALTRALGERLSPEDTQPEVYCWTDNGGSSVTATFVQGRLTQWEMRRPPDDGETQPTG
jgi:hypothetical protein